MVVWSLLGWHALAGEPDLPDFPQLPQLPSLAPGEPTAGGSDREPSAPPDRDLESRLAEMERVNRELVKALETTRRDHDAQLRLLLKELGELRLRIEQGGSTPVESRTETRASESRTPASGASSPATSSGGDGGGTRPGGGSALGVPSYTLSGIRGQPKIPLTAHFGNGFELETEDGEYQLQVHQQIQTDARFFSPNGDLTYRDNFVIPRARIFFNGRLTKPWEYMFSINRGFGNLDVLDAYINYRPSDALQLKVGRFMTPFNYEQFAVQNMWLIAPERSLFTSNLGLNRQIGAQLWGQVWKKRVDYATGVFDGPRNSFEDFNAAKDIMAYVNVRPFGERDSPFKYLNLGGSFVYGLQDNPLVPASWRTAANASNAGTANTVAPPFYVFDPLVRERGVRSFWSAHMAYFYKRLSLLADYNGAILRYAPSPLAPQSVTIPVEGYSIALGYFITGETVDRRTIVEPLRPFDLRPGRWAPGAVEVIARYNLLHFDSDMLVDSLTDPALWSNRAWATNLGINWYLTRSIKFVFDWQHSEFGKPVFYAEPNRKQLTNELFWFRFQVYY